GLDRAGHRRPPALRDPGQQPLRRSAQDQAAARPCARRPDAGELRPRPRALRRHDEPAGPARGRYGRDHEAVIRAPTTPAPHKPFLTTLCPAPTPFSAPSVPIPKFAIPCGTL